MNEKKPNNPSSDYAAMKPYWDMVSTILNGASAMRKAGTKYLPQFPNESDADYRLRKENAKFTNIYRDIVENLAAKPFGQELAIGEEKASPRVEELAEDIDGQGNHIHVFAGNLFFGGINNGIDWVMVDFTKGLGPNATQAQERAAGARPYWVHIPAPRLLAAYSAMIGGKEEFVHVRIHEPETVRDGYGEKTVNRVRILNREPMTPQGATEPTGYGPATYEIWEEKQDTPNTVKKWELVEGPFPITIGVIPIVPFLTGRRKGGSWVVDPPMKDAAYLQIEHYQQESGLKYAKELTAFPMLAGNGVAPPVGEDGKTVPVPVGPKTVLYAPPNGEGEHGEWQFIEPTAESLRFLADDIKETARELRELGRQPLTAQSGNLTVVTTAFAAQKGNTAIQAWAINLKDSLENCLKLTAKWLGEEMEAEVSIDTDFDLGLGDDDGYSHVLALRATGDLSQETVWAEGKRRNILGPDFDGKAEVEKIMEEVPDDDEDDVKDALPPQRDAA